MIFFIFAQNVECKNVEAALTSTHNLCFRAKIRKNVYPYKPPFYYIKVGCKGEYITRTCKQDEYQVICCLRVSNHLYISTGSYFFCNNIYLGWSITVALYPYPI